MGNQLLAYLKAVAKGRERALTAKQLSRIFRTTEREIRETISRLRDEGHLIASTVKPPYGFFVPCNKEEVDETSRQLWSRVGQIAKTARAFDAAANSAYDLGRHEQEQIKLVFGG